MIDKYTQKFSKRFTKLLKNSDLTYGEIAKKLGLKSKSTICKYANGSITVTVSTIVKLAKIFDVSPIWLAGLDDKSSTKD